MSDSDIEVKRKHFRKLPVFGAILMFILSFFHAIPLDLLPLDAIYEFPRLTMEILVINGQQYFLWGVMNGSTFQLDFSSVTVETLLSIVIFLCGAGSIICGLIGSSYKERPTTMKKIVKIAMFLALMLLIYYIGVYITMGILAAETVQIGAGFYVLIATVIIYTIGFAKITPYNEIEDDF